MVSLLSNMTRCLGIRVEKIKYERVEHCPSDIKYLNLGIRVAGEKMCVIIPSNTTIPIKKEKILSNVEYPYGASFQVYEGESSWTKENAFLGGFILEGIPPAPLVVSQIKVGFDIDVNGTLTVSAQHMVYSKVKKEITITSKQRQSAKLQKAKHSLKEYAKNIQMTLGFGGYGYPGKLKAEEKEKIKKVANEAIKWLNKNKSANEYEYKDKLKQVEELCKPIITKMYQQLDSGGQNKSCNVVPETAF